MAQKVYLSFLWHQHQPFYEDLKTGRAILPWVRLHATKDYYDMVGILDRYPKIRMTVNLVPSLLVQLENFAQNRCTDTWLEQTLNPANQLTAADKSWILENFFYCNWDNMIFPNERYAELFEKRGHFASREKIERSVSTFRDQDFLDLQCWFNLAWIDPSWKDKDETIGHLYQKGKGFTEEEKQALVEKQREICRLTIAKHKELWRRGQIEISTTPFYHPILPLLCDSDSAQMSMPGSSKPKKRFQHPEDAAYQIEKSLQYMEKIFDKRPVGMWPSEGSVSKETAAHLARSKVEWAATDEGILFRSLGRESIKTSKEMLYQPYLIENLNGGQSKLQMVFRDHTLSDAIGFAYSRMDPKKAVADFISRITKIADSVTNHDDPPLVSVILDGENCWEHYQNDGNDFLNELYRSLSDHPRIETTTIGGFIKQYPAKSKLNQLWSGSWINSDFGIWIGHAEDNRAWDLVNETRQHIVDTVKEHPEKEKDPSVKKAWESLYIAEGSDWCWWYGDQNSTAHDEVFDELFRNHLKNVYHFLGEDPPDKLGIAIKGKQEKDTIVQPLALITPKIDGLVTSYFEWKAGGFYQTSVSGSAMQQAEHFLASFHYGFDLEKLYIRMDPKIALKETLLSEIKIKCIFLEPVGNELQIDWELQPDGSVYHPKALFLNQNDQTIRLNDLSSKKIIELGIPFSYLSVQPKQPVEFAITVLKQGIQIERWPYQSSIKIQRPTEDFGSEFWIA